MNLPRTNLPAKPTPSALGYRMPAEWEPHDATWLSWPHNQETWPGKRLSEVQEIYFQMLEAILPSEKVHLLVCDEREQEEVTVRLQRRQINSKNLIYHRAPTVDVWIRDYGPTFLTLGSSSNSNDFSPSPLSSPPKRGRGQDEGKAWCKWIFNAWGGKYPSLIKDTGVFSKGRGLIPYPCFETDLVLEGGSIEVNGEGVCLTTEQCLLNRNRNPQLSRPEIEKYLRDHLGVSHIVWLAEGIVGDDTDGHIDDLARFVNTTTILAAHEENEADENYPILKKDWELLEKVRDQQTRKWDLIKLPMPGKVMNEGVRLPASYANFYIANRTVLLPIYDDPCDREAIGILKEVFPDRLIIPIPSKTLIDGLGAIHCVTQQEPL